MSDERHEWIGKRAYALWEEGGRQDGRDYENWLRATADRDLLEATRASSDGSEVLNRTRRPVSKEMRVVSSSEKVLVVDDEAEIRFNTVAVLEDAGYETFEAANASEALIWLQKHDVKVVVTDVNMPAYGWNGPRQENQSSMAQDESNHHLWTSTLTRYGRGRKRDFSREAGS